ncbi:MAG: DUF1737 domain-containing protein [Cohaesibacteraceae bacterium]|nr:DUF1737 domain-containing protein [Cohaesibacteraceae bacterium]PCH82164.1 MAG: hypothetical protein COB90_01820 [Hyphomicrobiales bacterium]
MKLYRLLTEIDDSVFCHKVSKAISEGWDLYGSPTYAFDAGEGVMKCGQAVVREVPEENYREGIKLSSYKD